MFLRGHLPLCVYSVRKVEAKCSFPTNFSNLVTLDMKSRRFAWKITFLEYLAYLHHALLADVGGEVDCAGQG